MSVLWLILALLPILGGAERFSCRGRILGAYYADAKSGCKAFHVCVRVAGGGIRDFRFFCPPGTLFHQEAQTCTDWGDDDPLACPADLYDGFDTKKLSSSNAREEEQEFGLQRAETGDRRLQQNSGSSNGASDLRAAHSSDFFSGQRERGRDDSAPPAPSAAPQPAPQRNSFRRPTTRVPSPFPTTQYTAAPSSLSPSQQPQYDERKRKLVRKRPIYYSTSPAPSTFAQSSPNPRQYFPEQNQKQQSFRPEQNQQQNYQKQEQIQQQQNYPKPEQKQTQNYPRPEQKQQNFRQQEQTQQNYPRPEQQNYPRPEQQNYQKVEQKQQQNFQRPNGEQKFNAPAPANVPPEYKDEYVEVSRVTPKSRNFQTATSSPSFPQSTPSQRFNKKEGLTDVFNYESPSTASFNPSERPFKVRNSFNVAPDVPRTKDVPRKNVAVSPNGVRASPSTADYNTAAPSTVNYRNFNSVSYEPEKNNFAQFTGKQKYFNSPSTTPGTTAFTTSSRPDTSARLNTVAYNTNIGFNAQPINYSESDEDDGQYRPPEGEDDGQYRPELYEKELLSGAHSLNIAASGNRLPEDQKPRAKPTSQSVPRPFRPAPTPSTPAPPPPSTTRAPEPTYTTTFRPQTPSTQRTFDYFQTYTTTARPEVERVPQAPSSSRAPARETPASRAPPPPTVAPTTRAPVHKAPPPPHFAQPANNKEDNSYDYAYYDTDSGFSEYDQIEEFGKTKARSS